MPNGHNGQRNGAGGTPVDHFAHSRRRIPDLENLSRGIGQARQHTVYGARGQLLTGSCIPVFHIHVAPGEPPPAHPRFVTLRLVQHRYADDHPERASPRDCTRCHSR